MSAPVRSLPGKLFRFASSAVLATIVVARAGGIPKTQVPDRPTSSPKQSEVDDAGSPWPELITYIVGYALALLLTGAAFGLVYWRRATPAVALGIVYGLGLVQIIVHFRCFLHVDLKRSARDDLSLVLFSTLIVILMVAGTLVLIFNLNSRMM